MNSGSLPLVSVIIITYKRPSSLEHAIQSVLKQTYPAIELIVVDDNDQDSAERNQTEAIVAKFGTVIYIKQAQHRNAAVARNTGISKATGAYISFLDDDDIYYPSKIQKSVEALRRYSADYGAVYCGYTGWRADNNDPSRYKEGDLTFELLALKYDRHYLNTNTALYKAEALQTIGGYDENFIRHQDLELNIRFFQHYKIGVVQEIAVGINPFSTEVKNYVTGKELYRVKEQFLEKFRHVIQQFDQPLQQEIYFQNWAEAMHSFPTPEDFREFVLTLPGREDLKFLNLELLKIEQRIHDLEASRAEMDARIAAKDDRILELESAAAEIGKSLELKEEMNKELIAARQSLFDTVTVKEGYISGLEAARQVLQGIIDEKSLYISALETSDASLKEAAEGLTGEVEDLKKRLKDAEDLLLTSEQEARDLSEKLKELEDLSAQLTKKLEEVNAFTAFNSCGTNTRNNL